MSEEWDCVFFAELENAALESIEAEILEAEKCRTQSDSEDEPPCGRRMSRWWALVLQDAMHGVGHNLQQSVLKQKTVSIVSGCTGSSAEAATLEAE